MPPKVSVNMCCYNGARYLREAIDSVVSQTFRDWEIVVIDDGSTDSTKDIFREFIDSGFPIRYYWQENAGLGSARRTCLEKSRGEYIAFLDQDDIWLPTKLERQIAAMEGTDFAACFGGVMEIDSVGSNRAVRIPKPLGPSTLESLLFQFDVHLPTTMVRRSSLADAGLSFDPSIKGSEEYCLFMQLAVKNNFALIREVLAKYRIHDQALTSKAISLWATERDYTLNLIEKNHPGIRKRFPTAFQKAYAHARYYHARYLISKNDRRGARLTMREIMHLDWRYLLLYLLLFFPPTLWERIHKWKSGRSH